MDADAADSATLARTRKGSSLRPLRDAAFSLCEDIFWRPVTEASGFDVIVVPAGAGLVPALPPALAELVALPPPPPPKKVPPSAALPLRDSGAAGPTGTARNACATTPGGGRFRAVSSFSER